MSEELKKERFYFRKGTMVEVPLKGFPSSKYWLVIEDYDVNACCKDIPYLLLGCLGCGLKTSFNKNQNWEDMICPICEKVKNKKEE